MQVIVDLFNLLFFAPIVNLLVLVLRVFESINLPGSLGFAIIVLSILIRLLVWPFITTQLRSAKKLADLKPHMDLLKRKHGSDKQALMRAQAELYKEHGVNPAGGCLPTLIQIPIFIALYQAIFAFFNGQAGLETVNNLLYFSSWHLNNSPDPTFLGLNLASKPSDFARDGIMLLTIPVISAVLTFVQSKMMVPKPAKVYPSDSPKEKKEKEGMEESMLAVQSQMVFLMPIMIGFFAWQFPVGLALYWNTFTLFGIIQQYKIMGWGGMESLVKSVKGKVKS